MQEYKIVLTPEEEKVLLTDIISIQEWCQNAISNKARQLIDQIVEQSGLGSQHTPLEKKLEIIRSLTLETAEEKNKIAIERLNVQEKKEKISDAKEIRT